MFTGTDFAATLVEGDEFSLDQGATWHVCAVNLSATGTVAVYADHTRTDDSPTVRVVVGSGDPVLIRACCEPRYEAGEDLPSARHHDGACDYYDGAPDGPEVHPEVYVTEAELDARAELDEVTR